MCMGNCSGSGKMKSNSYTPKKSGAAKRSGSYTPKGRMMATSSYGKPQVRVSFSGKK